MACAQGGQHQLVQARRGRGEGAHVADGGHEEERAHDDGLHALRGLVVRVLEPGDGREDLGDRDQHLWAADTSHAAPKHMNAQTHVSRELHPHVDRARRRARVRLVYEVLQHRAVHRSQHEPEPDPKDRPP